MDYEKRITEMLKDAMKAGDKTRLMALRAVKSVLTNERTRHSGPLSDDDSLKAIASHRKKMAGALEQYREAGRDNLAASAEVEVAVCDELLPAQVGDDELLTLIDARIAETGASSMKDLGKVIGPVMKQLAGRVDGNRVRELVSKRLGG